MGIARSTLLWISENEWMRENVPNYAFVKKASRRFMPGETVEDAITEALKFGELGIKTVFTYLGENVKDFSEAEQVTEHYIDVIDKIKQKNLTTGISIKLTQLGFDLSFEKTQENFRRIAAAAESAGNSVWIDMEQSRYVDRTLEFYRSVKTEFPRCGLCLQSYLYRTKDDLENLLDINPNIRLVKGAYKEPAEFAFPQKEKVDENYFELSKVLLKAVREQNIRAAFATHDIGLINMIEAFAKANDVKTEKIEFQMLYGIKTAEQIRLAKEGYHIRVLVSYGSYWFPWYVRRLAERPANIGFVLRNIFYK